MTRSERFVDPLRIGLETLAVGSGEGPLAGVTLMIKNITTN